MPFSTQFFCTPRDYDIALERRIDHYWTEAAAWTLVKVVCGESNFKRVLFPNVWQLRGFFSSIGYQNEPASHSNAVLDHIARDLGPWLRAESHRALTVPQDLKLPLGGTFDRLSASSTASPDSSNEDRIGLTLQVVLSCVNVLAEKQRKYVDEMERYEDFLLSSHIRFAERASVSPVYPEPNLARLSTGGRGQAGCLEAAILSFMRVPHYTDAAADFMFERYLKASVGLLFGSDVLFLRQSDCTMFRSATWGLPSSDAAIPLVVACGCTEFSEQVQQDMAVAVEPMLSHLVRTQHIKNGPETSLPSFCFIYGIHWSRTRVRILVHFPAFNSATASWEYTQIVLAEHMHGWSISDTGRDCMGRAYWNDVVLRRWRLTAAFLAIHTHVSRLKAWLMPSTPAPSASLAIRPALTPDMGGTRNAASESPPTHCASLDQYIMIMRNVWSTTPWKFPKEWLSLDDFNLNVDEKIETEALSSLFFGKILVLALTAAAAPLILLPPPPPPPSPPAKDLDDIAPRERLVQRPGQPSYSLYPHLPRISRTFGSPRLEKGLGGTTSHQMRLLDFLSMQVTTWSDINIFVAAVFSGFHDYELLWRPETACEQDRTGVTVDFALALQDVPQNEDAPPRGGALYLASPIVLIGLRSDDMDNDPSIVTETERNALREIAFPYVLALGESLKLQTRPSRGEPEPSHHVVASVIFCTFLKAGIIHIIAIPVPEATSPTSPASQATSPTSPASQATSPISPASQMVHLSVIDSMPISMCCAQPSDYQERLRIFVALSTLQQHVATVSQQRCGVQYDGTEFESLRTESPSGSTTDEALSEFSEYHPGLARPDERVMIDRVSLWSCDVYPTGSPPPEIRPYSPEPKPPEDSSEQQASPVKPVDGADSMEGVDTSVHSVASSEPPPDL